MTRPSGRTSVAAGQPDAAQTPCAQHPELYLHPLLQEPPEQDRVSEETWQEFTALWRRGQRACAGCPLLDECLYRAVVQTDIAGFVACTTPEQRTRIRGRLGVRTHSENLDDAAGRRAARRPVSHAEVRQMRARFPDDTYAELAVRLDCSLSTVKRHMRRIRRDAEAGADTADDAAEPSSGPGGLPTVEQVLDAFDEVVDG